MTDKSRLKPVAYITWFVLAVDVTARKYTFLHNTIQVNKVAEFYKLASDALQRCLILTFKLKITTQLCNITI